MDIQKIMESAKLARYTINPSDAELREAEEEQKTAKSWRNRLIEKGYRLMEKPGSTPGRRRRSRG